MATRQGALVLRNLGQQMQQTLVVDQNTIDLTGIGLAGSSRDQQLAVAYVGHTGPSAACHRFTSACHQLLCEQIVGQMGHGLYGITVSGQRYRTDEAVAFLVRDPLKRPAGLLAGQLTEFGRTALLGHPLQGQRIALYGIFEQLLAMQVTGDILQQGTLFLTGSHNNIGIEQLLLLGYMLDCGGVVIAGDLTHLSVHMVQRHGAQKIAVSRADLLAKFPGSFLRLHLVESTRILLTERAIERLC